MSIISHKKSGGRVISGWLIQQLYSILMNSDVLFLSALFCSAQRQCLPPDGRMLLQFLALGICNSPQSWRKTFPPGWLLFQERNSFPVATGKLSFRFTWQGLCCTPVPECNGSWEGECLPFWVSIVIGGSYYQGEVGGLRKLGRQATRGCLSYNCVI